MSRAALQRSMRNAAKSGGVASGGDPFSILEEYQPPEEHLLAALPMHGNTTTTFNLEHTLAHNIVSDNYFKWTLLDTTEWPDLLEAAR